PASAGRLRARPGLAHEVGAALARIARIRDGVDVALQRGLELVDRYRDADDLRAPVRCHAGSGLRERHQHARAFARALLHRTLPRAAGAGAVERGRRVEAHAVWHARAL